MIYTHVLRKDLLEIKNSLDTALKGKHVGIQELGNGIWKVFYRNVLLGYFDEKHLRNKQQSTRLETNLV